MSPHPPADYHGCFSPSTGASERGTLTAQVPHPGGPSAPSGLLAARQWPLRSCDAAGNPLTQFSRVSDSTSLATRSHRIQFSELEGSWDTVLTEFHLRLANPKGNAFPHALPESPAWGRFFSNKFCKDKTGKSSPQFDGGLGLRGHRSLCRRDGSDT